MCIEKGATIRAPMDAAVAVALLVAIAGAWAVVLMNRRFLRIEMLLLGVLAAVPFGLLLFALGLHHCDAGYPPPHIAIAFAVTIAALMSVSTRRDSAKSHVRPVVASVLVGVALMGAATERRLAGRYHAAGVTGNPRRASGAYWFSWMTGVRPARADKRLNASSDAQCREDDQCKWFGQCSVVDGACGARVDADCGQDPCRNGGRCTARGLECVADHDADCRASNACRNAGACVARSGACVVADEAACLGTIDCKQFGACGLVNGACRPRSDEDCAKSDECMTSHRCVLRGAWCATP